MSGDVVFLRCGHGYDRFRVTVAAGSDKACFTATVDEVVGWDTTSGSPVTFEPYLRCSIKWDSCSHFNFGPPGEDGQGYLHLCGVADFMAHARLIRDLYELAFQRMGRPPLDDERWDEPTES